MPKRPHRALDPANFAISIILALLIGVGGSLGAEIVKGTAGQTVWLGFLAILAAIVALGIVLSERIQRWMRRNREFLRVGQTPQVTRARALIAFVSKGPGRASARDAALYHAGDGVLQHLWLVTSADAEPDAEWVRAEVSRERRDVTIYPPVCISDIYSIVDAKEEIEKIRKALVRKGLATNDIICDFTGMTKHMSAGMILACAPKEARLQFMHPQGFLADGRANPAAGPSQPVEVEIAYQVEEEE